MKIKVISKSKHKLPEYYTETSAGMDLKANLDNTIVLKQGKRVLEPTRLFLEISTRYGAQIGPRRGLSIKKGIAILNSPVTIDADYRGEVSIILVNLSNKNFVIEDGERICQMVIAKHEIAEWESVDMLLDSKRGCGGFGHTGKK